MTALGLSGTGCASTACLGFADKKTWVCNEQAHAGIFLD